MTTRGPVSVIVPVYSGRDATNRCLASVIRHAAEGAAPFDLVLVDDCTPEPGLRADLDTFARASQPVAVRLLRNASNLGFVSSVNRAMRETSGDVVLLNSDTVVTAGWLDRLVTVADGSPDVATVTPLTNDGSICSLPGKVLGRFDLDGPVPEIDRCAAFVTDHGLGLCPEVITGVGFCMFITRSALDECGLFDEATFGKGYGEEVDFCLRATRMGYRHLVDDRTFVFHEGGVSFGGSRATGMARASAVIRDRYRFFAPTNRRERVEDPLAVSFAALELALDEVPSGRPQVLHVMHAPSAPLGGTERHVEALTRALADQIDSSVLFPVESGFVLRRMTTAPDGLEQRREFLLPGGATQVSSIDDRVAAAALRMALDLFDFDAVHLHNLIGHSLAPLEVCRDFPGPVVCTFHDFYLACPNHSLLFQDRIDCGIPDDLSVCANCLPNSRTGGSVETLQLFRERASSAFEVVDRVIVGDIVTSDYVQRVHTIPPERISVIEFGSIIGRPDRRDVDESAILDDPLRLAFIGRAWEKKGLGIVNHAAAALAGSGVELHHFGPPNEPLAEEVIAHGAYANVDLPDLLHEAGIHIVLLPGPCAETYSYVMTEALVAGLPLIGAGHGALGHRIRTLGVGWTIDPTEPATVVELIRNLDRCRPEVIRATTRACLVPIASADGSAGRYVDLYLGAPIRSRTMSRSSTMADDHMRRHLRALAAVNRQLQAQVAEQPPTTGRRLAVRSREALERVAPRVFRCAEIGFETSATARAVVASARDAARRRTARR